MLPTFVESHVHFDKAFTAHRTGTPRGGLMESVSLTISDTPNRTRDDVFTRAQKALALAYRHGTSAIRTHLDTYQLPSETPAWDAYAELRADWRDRIELQAVSLMALERVENPDFRERCQQLAERGGVLGAFVPDGMASAARLDTFLTEAGNHGLDVDFHVDETLDPHINGLGLIADSVLKTGYRGRVLAGHCCSLSTRDPDGLDRHLEKIARSGLHIVSLPHSNLYLQDRSADRTPRYRGLTLAHELRAAGVPVHFASDNVQDAFFPYGRFDMLEVMNNAARIGHLDYDFGTWMSNQHRNAAAATGFQDQGTIALGKPADFILFDATDWVDLLSHSQTNRLVFRNGRTINSDNATLSALIALEMT